MTEVSPAPSAEGSVIFNSAPPSDEEDARVVGDDDEDLGLSDMQLHTISPVPLAKDHERALRSARPQPLSLSTGTGGGEGGGVLDEEGMQRMAIHQLKEIPSKPKYSSTASLPSQFGSLKKSESTNDIPTADALPAPKVLGDFSNSKTEGRAVSYCFPPTPGSPDDERGPRVLRRGSFVKRSHQRSNSESELFRMYDLEIDEFEQLKRENLALKAKVMDLEKRIQQADLADTSTKGVASICNVCGLTRMHVDESDKDVCYTVLCAEKDRKRFANAEAHMSRLITRMTASPYDGHIRMSNTRQINLNGSALSYAFFSVMQDVIEDEEEALQFVREVITDVAQKVGLEDWATHSSTAITIPRNDVQTHLCAVGVKLAFAGFGRVEVANGLRHPDEGGYHQIFTVRNSFESESFLRAEKRTSLPVCAMCAGYIAGWAEGSFKVPMACSEITCRARGDACCRFLLAPPYKINTYVKRYSDIHPHLNVCTRTAHEKANA